MIVSVDASELARLYTEEHLTTRQIAPLVGMSSRTILRRLRAFGVPLRNPGTPVVVQLSDREWLRRVYVDEGKSTPEIARVVGCGIRSVALWLKRHGIPSRPTGSTPGHTRNDTEAVRGKMRAAKMGKFIGPDNPNWKGGIATKDPERNRYQSKMWVKAVKDRDGWKCRECGATERLHAHHIKRWRDYPDLRYELSNGITLCHPCHEEAHGHGFKFRWRPVRRKPTSASVQ